MQRFLTCGALLGALIGWTAPAAAWGPEGHAIVADIAEAHLTPAASAEVTRLLALENVTRLDEISSWADAWRPSHPETGQWHFVDIPLDAAAYDEARDCHYGEHDQHSDQPSCVIAKIGDFANILADKTQSDADRLAALKYLVHFVGDLHQPLHAEDKNHDRGGNLVKLTWHQHDTNLHALWDGWVIETHYGWVLGPNYSFDHPAVAAQALLLDQSIAPADRAAWSKGSALSWVAESHGLARDAYDRLPASPGADWEGAYQAYAWPVIELQLKKGGVRLAEMLNEALPAR